MKTELLLVVMAGTVLSLFLIVGELAAMRKRARRLRAHLLHLYESEKFLPLFLEVCAIAAFFLVQPVVVGFLVALALNGLNPEFSHLTAQQLWDAL